MWQQFVNGLTWLLSTSGPPLVVLGVLGFVFREKWKQLLTRSMTRDMERLKHELALAQQNHAASLAPQLEAMKHDFHKNLEAYKTSLIAQAEEVKLKSDLKKSLGTRYLEVKFTRFMNLEKHIASAGSMFTTFVAYPMHLRSQEQVTEALAALGALGAASAESEMFLEIAERQILAKLRVNLSNMLNQLGPGPDKQVIAINGPESKAFITERIAVEQMIRAKIHQLAGL